MLTILGCFRAALQAMPSEAAANIRVMQVFTSFNLLAQLDRLRQAWQYQVSAEDMHLRLLAVWLWFLSALGWRSSFFFFLLFLCVFFLTFFSLISQQLSPPRLLVIDSLAGVIAPHSGASSRGFGVMTAVARAIKALAFDFNIAILVRVALHTFFSSLVCWACSIDLSSDPVLIRTLSVSCCLSSLSRFLCRRRITQCLGPRRRSAWASCSPHSVSCSARRCGNGLGGADHRVSTRYFPCARSHLPVRPLCCPCAPCPVSQASRGV
jgi:hypothetical protein